MRAFKSGATNFVSLLNVTYNMSAMSTENEILQIVKFVEHWTGALQVQPRFRNTQ